MSDLMPNDWRTLFLIGLKHFTEGDAEKALLYADQCIEAAPEERKYIGMMQKATVLRFLERNDESKTMLVKTIQSKHDPSDTNALKIMTHAHMMLHKLGIEGKHAELAMDYVNKLIQESPDKTDAKITRGILSSTLGNIEDALPDLQLAVETYPDDYQYKGELANCLSILGEFVEARELWKKAIEIAPDNADVYLGMAMNELAYASTIEENEQIIKEGIDLLKKAVTLDPNHKIANDVLKNIFQSMTGPE
jgi:tetratricopeptide (TPR) repeat protein